MFVMYNFASRTPRDVRQCLRVMHTAAFEAKCVLSAKVRKRLRAEAAPVFRNPYPSPSPVDKARGAGNAAHVDIVTINNILAAPHHGRTRFDTSTKNLEAKLRGSPGEHLENIPHCVLRWRARCLGAFSTPSGRRQAPWRLCSDMM